MRGVDDRNFVIVGGTDWRSEFGVYEFLERYVGVRWLLPTELGADVPKLTSLRVPRTQVKWKCDFTYFVSAMWYCVPIPLSCS